MEKQKYHTPALLNECIEGLNINPDGTYVDVTFGGGGHSRAIVSHLSNNGHLYSFDQDLEAYANRIVRLVDGQIVSDTNPYDDTDVEITPSTKQGHASMSAMTSATRSDGET